MFSSSPAKSVNFSLSRLLRSRDCCSLLLDEVENLSTAEESVIYFISSPTAC